MHHRIAVFSLLSRYKQLAVLLTVCTVLLLGVVLGTVDAQTVNGISFSDDPAVSTTTTLSFSSAVPGGGMSVSLYINGSLDNTATAYPAANPSLAYMGGWNAKISGAAGGASITANPGGGGCTVVKSGGYTYCGVAVPAPPDTDGDTIIDSIDQCDNSPGPSPHGCPDTDGDGYHDGIDACPTKGDYGFGVDANGCPPDSDGDGFYDGPDECRTQSGIGPTGCPDTDGDGYLDRVDSCPNEGNLHGFGVDRLGCPRTFAAGTDADGDGFPDDVDACPNEGIIPYGMDSRGCGLPAPNADSDGDGTPDGSDSCPFDPNNGCSDPLVITDPEIVVRPRAVINLGADCNTATNLSTAINAVINVRASDSTDAAIIGSFTAVDGPFDVIGSSAGWVKISFNGNEGWVASEFLQAPAGTNCTEKMSTPTPTVEPAVAFAECPDALAWIDQQAPELKAAYLNSTSPCELYQAALEETADQGILQYISTSALDALIENCGTDAMADLEFIIDEFNSDPVLLTQANTIILSTTDCAELSKQLLGLSQSGGTDPLVCNSRNPNVANAMQQLAAQLGLTISDLDGSVCRELYDLSRKTENISSSEIGFFNKLKNCNISVADRISWLAYALGNLANFEKLLAMPDATLCDNIQAAIYTTFLPDMPSELTWCVKDLGLDALRFWEIVNRDPSPFTSDELAALWAIHPKDLICEAIRQYLDDPTKPLPTVPPPTVTLVPTEEARDPVNQPPNATPQAPIVVTVVSSTVAAPVVVPPTDADPTATDEPDKGVFTTLFESSLAVFVGLAEDGQSSDIYLLANSAYYAVNPNSPANEHAPIFHNSLSNELIYLQELNGTVTLVHQRTPILVDSIYSPSGYTFDVNSRMAWHSTEARVWVTLLDAEGNPSIWELDLTTQTMLLVIEKSRNPVSNLTHLVYERITPNGSRIEVQNFIASVSSSNSNPVLAMPSNVANCLSPAFFLQNLVAFSCDGKLYTSPLFGMGSINELPLPENISPIQNIAYVPNMGYYLSFDDGTTIYFMNVADREVQELLRVDIELTSALVWR